MRLFPLHILIKDSSFMIIYFIIMKYNLTNETYLPETISNFQGAPDMIWLDILTVSIFYNLFTLIMSFICYFPIVWIFRKVFSNKKKLRLIATALVLTGTTPSFYLWAIGWKQNAYYQLNAVTIALTLTFTISIYMYWMLNKNEEIKTL